MCDKAFEELRRAVDEKHREAHRKITELEEYLAGSGGAATPTIPGKSADNQSDDSEPTTSRGLVDRNCATWANVAQIAAGTGLTVEQVRGVLYDPHYKSQYEKRKLKGAPMKFRVKPQ